MKHSWTNSFKMSCNFEWGIVVMRVETSNALMLLYEERDSNKSLAIVRIHISFIPSLEQKLVSQ